MKELIDRNALIAEYDRVHIGPPGGARKLMEDAPTVVTLEATASCEDPETGYITSRMGCGSSSMRECMSVGMCVARRNSDGTV